jgi:hypothetical protein
MGLDDVFENTVIVLEGHREPDIAPNWLVWYSKSFQVKRTDIQ